MTGSLVVYDRVLTRDEVKYAVLTCTIDDGRLLVYRTCAGWAPSGCSTKRDGTPIPAASARSRSRDVHAVRVRRPVERHARRGEEGDHGPASGGGSGQHLRQEALFEAGIDPSKPTNKLSLDEFARCTPR